MRLQRRDAFFVILAMALVAPATADTRSLELAPLDLGTGPHTAQPSVAVDPGRGFIVTWQRRDGDRATLEFAELAADGALRRRGVIADSATTGADGAAARWFVNWADFPSLVVLDNGDWVAHWLQKTGGETYAYEVRLVRSTDRGRSWSASIVPHDDGTPTEHGFVSMVPAGDDRVRLAWLDGRETAAASSGHQHDGHGHGGHGGRMTLRSAVVDRRGRIREDARLDAATCSCCQTDMVRTDGRTVLAYRDHGEGDLRNIHWIAHQAGRWTDDRPVHDDGWRIAGCPVNGPALAAGDAGVLAAWPTMLGEAMAVRAALAGRSGFGAPVLLESAPGTVGRVDAAAWGDGYLVAWLGATGIQGASALRLVALDARLRVRARHVVADLPPGRSSGVPRMAAADGTALIAWVEADGGAPTVRMARVRDAPRP